VVSEDQLAPLKCRAKFASAHGATRTVSIAMVILASVSPADHSRAANPRSEDSWTSLTDEPSRGQLFRTKVEAAARAQNPDVESGTLAIPKLFRFPSDARYDTIEKHDRVNSTFCVDLSHWTSPGIHLELLRLQSVRCVYTKATQGSRFADDSFKKFWPQLGALPADSRVLRGAYHFISSDSDGTEQADAFVDYVNLHGGFKSNDLPPALDLEWDVSKTNPDQWVGKTADQILKIVQDCASRVKQRTGRTPVIYTALSWFGPHTIPVSRFSELGEYPVWIADYNPKRKLSETPAVPPGVKQLLWQFTDAALVTQGYSGRLDASIFYGSEEQFKLAFGVVEVK
jgi:lysozyme